MLYLVTQIVLCLLFTTLVGLTLGWLLRGMGTARQIDQVDADWRAQMERLQSQREQLAIVAHSQSDAPRDSGELMQLREQLAIRERQIETLQAGNAQSTTPTTDAQTTEKLQQSRALCQQLQVRLAEYTSSNEQFEKQLEHIQSERHNIANRLRDTEGEVSRLTQERENAIHTIAVLQKDLRSVRGTLARQEQLQRETTSAVNDQPPVQASAHSATSEKPATAASKQTPPVGPATTPVTALPATEAINPPSTSEDSQQKLPIDTPESDKPPPYRPAWRLELPDGNRDNLQAIYGVGPKLEQRLNDMGIFHFRQIASFDKRDILWVAEHLRSFPGRILRDRWVEQARTLESRRHDESGDQG